MDSPGFTETGRLARTAALRSDGPCDYGPLGVANDRLAETFCCEVTYHG